MTTMRTIRTTRMTSLVLTTRRCRRFEVV